MKINITKETDNWKGEIDTIGLMELLASERDVDVDKILNQ